MTVDEHIQIIHEWAQEAKEDWVPEADEGEIIVDCAKAYIDSELGRNNVQALQIARRIGFQLR